MVVEIPIEAVYGDEMSNLKIPRIVGEFFAKNLLNFFKRILYNYFLRGFSIASVQLILVSLFFCFGAGYGAYFWHLSWKTGAPATSGTVMVAGLPIIIGIQLLLAFFSYDMQNRSGMALHRRL